MYSYNIQSDDEGQLQAVSVEGGALTDENGNSATLSCPVITGNTIVANKTGIITNNTENQDTTTGNTSSSSSSSGTSSSSSSSSSSKTDSSTASKTLPNTGKDIAVYGTVALVIVLGIAGVVKYNKYKDIK